MAHTENNSQALGGSQEAFEQLVKERLRQAVRVALIRVVEEEVTAFIGAHPYERSEQRRDQRNGHDTRHLQTTVGQLPDLPVPRTRHGYQTHLFERYHRRRDDLDSAIAEMFVGGVSMAKVGHVVETLDFSQPRVPRRSPGSFTAWRANMNSGSRASWRHGMPMRLRMGPTSP